MKTMFDDIVQNVGGFLKNRETPKTGVRFVKNGKGVGVLVEKTDFENLYKFCVYVKENVVMELRCPIIFDESDQCYNTESEMTPANIGEMALEITNVINELLNKYDINMKKYLPKEMLEDE